jgi:hypothetical protein
MRRNEHSSLSPLEIRARQFGADYLMSIASWVLKTQPRILRRVRSDYRQLCVSLLRRIERGQDSGGHR